MKTYLTFIISLFFLNELLGTSIYELKYKFDKSENKYTAFVVRYDNNTGFMRIRVKDISQNEVLVSMDFDIIIDTIIGYMIFSGKNPKVLSGNMPYYFVDNFYFRKATGKTNYEPWFVTSPSNLRRPSKMSRGEITSSKLLNTDEITQEYAALFFDKNDPFYNNLFKNDSEHYSDLFEVKKSPRLKLVMIANTLDEEIGESCATDILRVKRKFSDIAKFMNLDFQYNEVSGSNFSKKIILETLNKLNSNYDDIIVVCYSGHGFRYNNNMGNPYPQFDLTTNNSQPIKENTINAIDVYNLLNKQQSHLKLLFTDCCNSEINLSKSLGQSNFLTARSKVRYTKSNCEKLFIDTKGTILVSAADAGEVAACNSEIGGYFLYHLIESIDKAINEFSITPSWTNIINETKNSVSNMVKYNQCSYKKCSQTSIYLMNLN